MSLDFCFAEWTHFQAVSGWAEQGRGGGAFEGMGEGLLADAEGEGWWRNKGKVYEGQEGFGFICGKFWEV